MTQIKQGANWFPVLACGILVFMFAAMSLFMFCEMFMCLIDINISGFAAYAITAFIFGWMARFLQKAFASISFNYAIDCLFVHLNTGKRLNNYAKGVLRSHYNRDVSRDKETQ